MKRKIALLLAIVMILAMVPAQAFARIPGSVGGRVPSPQVIGTNNLTLHMDAGHIRSAGMGVINIPISLDGHANLAFLPPVESAATAALADAGTLVGVSTHTIGGVPVASRAAGSQPSGPDGFIASSAQGAGVNTATWDELFATTGADLLPLRTFALTQRGIDYIAGVANTTPGGIAALETALDTAALIALHPSLNGEVGGAALTMAGVNAGRDNDLIWQVFVRQDNTPDSRFPNNAWNTNAGNPVQAFMPETTVAGPPEVPGVYYPPARLVQRLAGNIPAWYGTYIPVPVGTPGVTFSPSGTPAGAGRLLLVNSTFAILQLTGPINPAAITVNATLPIRINVAGAQDRITARLSTMTGQLLADDYLTLWEGSGITINYEPETNRPIPNFLERVTLNDIHIRESHVNAMGANPGNRTIRLVAPRGYTWTNLNNIGTGDGQLQLFMPAAQSFLAGTVVSAVQHTNLAGAQELVMVVNLTRVPAGSALATLSGEFRIRNLGLAAEWNTQARGDVNVSVMVGGHQPGGPGTTISHGVTPASLSLDVSSTIPSVRAEALRTWESLWAFNPTPPTAAVSLLVARHVTALLTLTTEEAVRDLDLPELRSGYVIGVVPVPQGPRPIDTTLTPWTQQAPWINRMGEVTTGRTAVIRVEENVFNALDVSRLRPVQFEFPEGVIVTGVEWRYYEFPGNLDSNATNWTTVPNRPNVSPPIARGSVDGLMRPNLNLQQTDAESMVIFEDDQTVILRPDLTTHEDLGNRTSRMRLEVRFFVSVEALFANNVSDEIEVAVSGLGVNNLPEANRTVPVATVFDPVVIEYVGDPIGIEMIGREQNIYHTDAGAVVITETDGGMLQLGTRLWVQLQTSHPAVGHDLVISSSTVFTDPDSELEVRVRPFTAGSTRIEIEVTRESQPGNPGTITFDEITLLGHVYQGLTYSLIVSGPAFAENHGGNATVAPAGVALSDIPGIFFTAPFAEQVVDLTGDPGVENRANSLEGVVFNPTVAIGGVTPPIIWRRLPGMAHEAGFVAARSFAVLAGVTDENINWASGVATISGWNYQGQWVTVILTQNSTTATVVVDGTVGTVDIAEFAEGQSGPAGTVAPIFYQNRIYLPFRFLFNAFGYSTDYTLSRVGNTAVVGTR